MVAYPIPKSLKLALTPTFAIALGAVVALGCMVVPSPVLEAAMLDSGIPALLPAAEPPLGWTARTALAMITGGASAAAGWLMAFLVLGGEGVVTIPLKLPTRSNTMPQPERAVPVADIGPVPVLRRADAHPDAPARAPLLALRDLGAPFLDVRAPKTPPVERDLPRDLDAPLSAFDPDAIPAVPARPVATVTPLAVVSGSAIHAPGERFEAFELHPPVPQPLAEPPIAAPRTDATIHALLDRLERGVSARGATREPQPGGVDDTLSALRRMATR